jgi:outer membrane protein OmpA-like peptidoglycan-associated protein
MTFHRSVRNGSTLALAATFSIALISCASPGKRTAIGAGTGGAVGAAIGAATGGWKGAAIGAGIGGAVGGSIGNYLDRQAQELEKVAETRRTADGIVVNLENDLLFNVDSAELKPGAVTELAKLGDIIAKYDRDRVVVRGFADSTGSDEHNLALSRERAASVERVLASRDVKPEQLRAEGRGETQPKASNATAQGRAQNRRVELVIDIPDPNRRRSLDQPNAG